VKWKHSEEDLIGVAKFYKTRRDTAAVAVEDKKSPSPSPSLLHEAIKDLGKPGKPKFVVRPS
jgi:hypothetical protein